LVALAGAALAAAWAALRVEESTECNENGWLMIVFIGLGAAAVIAGVRLAGARLRWGVVAAIPYGAIVFLIAAAHAIGHCTS
jgi:hypothetical protein